MTAVRNGNRRCQLLTDYVTSTANRPFFWLKVCPGHSANAYMKIRRKNRQSRKKSEADIAYCYALLKTREDFVSNRLTIGIPTGWEWVCPGEIVCYPQVASTCLPRYRDH